MESSDVERERDRNRRNERQSRFSDFKKERSRDNSKENRIYVSNIPYEYGWKEVKDLFRKHVGDVAFVELFNDEKDRPRGCGIVEFSSSDSVKKAMEVMHRFPIDGRKLVIKEDYGCERDKYGHVVNGRSRDDMDKSNDGMSRGGGGGGDNWGRGNSGISGNMGSGENFNTFGLSLQFLESIGVRGPLSNKVFVANLDYKVDKPKLKEIFKMSGKVRNIDLSVDKDGNSRGFAVIEYDHPVEAVQAISMFDKQILFERKLTVRMDRVTGEKSEVRLPEGLKGIGLGLGSNGEPLHNVAQHIATQGSMGGGGGAGNSMPNILPQAGILGAVPSAAGLSLGNVNPAFNAPSIGGNNLNTNLGLQALGLSNLGSLQNQILQQGLAAAELGMSTGGGGPSLGVGMQDLNSGSQLQNGMMGNGNMGAFNRNMNISQNIPQQANMGNMARQSGGNQNFFNNQQTMDSMMSSSPLFSNNRNNDDSMQFSSNQQKSKDTIHISNLPSSMTWQLLREKFGEVGEVKYADKIGKDVALIRFQNEWSAQRAIKTFDRTRIDGRTIEVRFY